MRYSLKEVRALVEGYAELREMKATYGEGLRILLKLADLNRAIFNMPPKEYHAVLTHGLMRHTLRDAEVVLGIAKSTLQDRYDAGLNWIVRYLNYGEE